MVIGDSHSVCLAKPIFAHIRWFLYGTFLECSTSPEVLCIMFVVTPPPETDSSRNRFYSLNCQCQWKRRKKVAWKMKMMPKSKGRCQDADLRGEDGSLKNLQWRWQAGSARLVLFEEFVWSLQIWNTGNAELRIFDCNATMELKPQSLAWWWWWLRDFNSISLT